MTGDAVEAPRFTRRAALAAVGGLLDSAPSSSGGDGQNHTEDHLVCGNCGQQMIGVDALSESGRSLHESDEQRKNPHRDGDLHRLEWEGGLSASYRCPKDIRAEPTTDRETDDDNGDECTETR